MSKSSKRLKVAVIESGVPQYRFASEAGIGETRMSRIVTGRVDPTCEECDRIERALGVPAGSVFGRKQARSESDAAGVRARAANAPQPNISDADESRRADTFLPCAGAESVGGAER